MVKVYARGKSIPKYLVWPGIYLLEQVGRVFGVDVPFTRRSLKFFTGNTAFSTEKASDVIGFQAHVDLSSGIGRTFDWIQTVAGL